MFCTSLRRRKDWAPAIPHLLQHEKFKFKENKIDTHDVNLPLPSPGAPGQRYLRFVLLSSTDHESNNTGQRVERLCHLTGGSDVAVVWLLGGRGNRSSFMRFQIELMDKFEIPLVPLQTLEDLPHTLVRFHRSFLQGDTSSRQLQGRVQDTSAVQTLLPYCALSPPLCEHSVNVLSDVTAGFADLINKASTDAGRAELTDYLGEQEAQRVIWFWLEEYLL